jgi:ketosteroid isomerase-like protein
MTVAANKELVKQFIGELESGDRDRLADLLSDDATWWLPGSLPVSGTYRGRNAVLDGFLANGLGLYQPDTLSFTIVSMIGEENTVAVEWVADGTSAAGERYHNFYHVAFDVRDEKICAVREYVDSLYVREVLFPSG